MVFFLAPLKIADHVDPGKKLIQIVMSAVASFPRQRKVNIVSVIFQHRGQNDGDGEGGVVVNGAVAYERLSADQPGRHTGAGTGMMLRYRREAYG